jgi:hypothetical protein
VANPEREVSVMVCKATPLSMSSPGRSSEPAIAVPASVSSTVAAAIATRMERVQPVMRAVYSVTAAVDAMGADPQQKASRLAHDLLRSFRLVLLVALLISAFKQKLQVV